MHGTHLLCFCNACYYYNLVNINVVVQLFSSPVMLFMDFTILPERQAESIFSAFGFSHMWKVLYLDNMIIISWILKWLGNFPRIQWCLHRLLKDKQNLYWQYLILGICIKLCFKVVWARKYNLCEQDVICECMLPKQVSGFQNIIMCREISI